jgi:hypothetical protein
MASKLLGRAVCPLKCGHEAAHVKIKTDKGEGKEAYPYVYCPACGFMGHTKNHQQAAALAALTRPEKTDSPVGVRTPTEDPGPVVESDPVAEPVPAPVPAPKVADGIFGLFRSAA